MCCLFFVPSLLRWPYLSKSRTQDATFASFVYTARVINPPGSRCLHVVDLAVQPHYRYGSKTTTEPDPSFHWPLVLCLLFNAGLHTLALLEGSCARPKVLAQGYSNGIDNVRTADLDQRTHDENVNAKRPGYGRCIKLQCKTCESLVVVFKLLTANFLN